MSEIRPSKLYMVAACPGSHTLEVPILPEGKRNVADEGVLAHSVLEAVLTGKAIPTGATPEMVRHAEWAAEVIEFHGEHGSEVKVDLGFLHEGMTGTVDAYAIDKQGDLHVFDYKYGHRPVEAKDNLQLTAYALGLMHGNELPSMVVLHILQPNISTEHKFHAYRGAEFYNLSMERLKKICYDAIHVPILRAGEHCRYCPKAYNCPKLKADANLPKVELELLSPIQMCQALDEVKEKKELINILQDSLEAAIIVNINKGVPGLTYQMEHGRSSLDWTSENIIDKLKKVEKATGISLITEKPCTPTQALNKKVPKEIIDKLSKRVPGKLSLKKIDFTKLFGDN